MNVLYYRYVINRTTQ